MNFKIGVDGGGSKTEAVLVDDTGNVVAVHLGAGSNPSLVGADQARSLVLAALESLRAQAGGHAAPAGQRPVITATLLCMAGNSILWREFARGLDHYGPVTAVDDSLPVLELATHGRPGIVLHGGTGSFVAARGPDSLVHYAGGLGWRFGDPGSGTDIGRRALARGLLDLQGLAPTSRLAQAAREHTGLTDAASITRYFYQDNTAGAKNAAFAPTVLKLAAEGDAGASQAVVQSVGELLDLAVRVGERLFSGSLLGRVTAGFSGPILTHPVARQVLTARAPFPLAAVEGTPIEGVRRMLVKLG